jgi:N-acetylneuraminic acid mutarotase
MAKIDKNMKANSDYPLKENKAISKVLLLSVCSIMYFCGTAFGQTVTKQLYLSDPGQALDRVDPVATADGSIAQTASLTPTSQYLFALRGASRTDFWRYDIAANSWTARAATPGTVSRGGALTTNGTYIYALRGVTADFWRYDPAANSWSIMASAPAAVSAGAALVHVNGSIYAFQGGTSTFWKYTIATNTWSVLASAPGSTPPASSPVTWGGALTTDGANIYALKGNVSNVFWKYAVATTPRRH